ncbi:hypothetical protein AVEN_108564-1 [Araneus ventricosus]|uniref:Uncharacterized protein n=1 Tax=Araneus ventricosus TaxID=182803 RepID=A0A4Y2DJD3_ARAVE|nr:hypothetical protein AVEN_108564-1 [Araneus ventricosus]
MTPLVKPNFVFANPKIGYLAFLRMRFDSLTHNNHSLSIIKLSEDPESNKTRSMTSRFELFALLILAIGRGVENLSTSAGEDVFTLQVGNSCVGRLAFSIAV